MTTAVGQDWREDRPQMTVATFARRWSLVPVLTCAGFVAGVYTSIVIEVMSYGTLVAATIAISRNTQ